MLALVRPRGGDGQSVNLGYMTPEDQVAEVQKGYEAIEAATGAEASHVFRTPGGNYGEGVMRNVGPLISAEIGWNIDSQDWRKPGAAAIANQVKNAWPGRHRAHARRRRRPIANGRGAQRRAPLSQVAGLPLRHHGRAARLSALLNLASAARRTKASFDLLRDRSPRDVAPLATKHHRNHLFPQHRHCYSKARGPRMGATVSERGSAVLHGR